MIREVSFKINDKLYSKYKSITMKDGMNPATHLTNYIKSYVINKYGDIRILQQNLDCRESKSYSLAKEERMNKIADGILIKHNLPEVCVFEEFEPHPDSGEIIINRLSEEYDFYFPNDYDYKCDPKSRLNCISTIAVKKGIQFKQIFISGEILASYRYIYGEISIDNNSFRLLALHVPNVSDPAATWQVERKKNMFQKVIVPVVNYCTTANKKLILCGDLNTHYGNEESICASEFKDILKLLSNTCDHNIPTFDAGTVIDYSLASPLFFLEGQVRTEVQDDAKNLSDHRCLISNISE